MNTNNILFFHSSKLVRGISNIKKDIEKSRVSTSHIENLKKNLEILEHHVTEALESLDVRHEGLPKKDLDYLIEVRNAFEGELDMLNDYWKHCLCQNKKGA